MRISLFLLPLFATLCSGITFKFNDCERLDVKGDITIKGPEQKPVTIPLANGTVSNSSMCDQSLIVYLPNGVRWNLIFNKKDNTLNQLVRFKPSELYKNDTLNSTMLPFDDDGNIDFKENTSFICQTPTIRKFEPSKDYQVQLNLQFIQVQAFDLPEDGSFSPGEHCEEDKTSTTPTEPTTTPAKEPTTTPAQEPTTTPSEEPTTPEAPTTEPPKGVLTFRLKDKDNKTCILMESKLDILLDYMTENGSAMAEVTIPEKGYKVKGSCPEGNSATLEVMFNNDSMRFHFGDSTGQAELSQVTMTIDMDPKRFPNATAKTLELETDAKWNIPLGNDKTFFFCNAGQLIPLDGKEKGNASMQVANLKVQAFHFAGQTFSGTGEDCEADKSTTPSTPTSTHIPPTPPSADVPNNYTVHDKATNVTCIRVKGVMNLTIAYNTTGNKMDNVSVVVPHEFKVGGNCNASATSQVMTVTFFEGWKLEFAFTNNVSTKVQASQVGADATTYFAVESIKLTYKLDDHFVKPAKPNATMQAALQVPEGGLKAQMGGSYMCNSDVTFGGSGDVSLKTTSFQYMAFNNKTGADFPDNGVTECSADLKDNSVVPIAVGAALAALVVIVLIAYLIGRRRSRRSGYESV